MAEQNIHVLYHILDIDMIGYRLNNNTLKVALIGNIDIMVLAIVDYLKIILIH